MWQLMCSKTTLTINTKVNTHNDLCQQYSGQCKTFVFRHIINQQHHIVNELSTFIFSIVVK